MAVVVDIFIAFLVLVAAVPLMRFKVNSVWRVLGGGVLGVMYRLLAG